MKYKAAYMKTFFDKMVLPYIIKDTIEVKTGEWYLINTKFGEDIGLAITGVNEVSKENFIFKRHVVENVVDTSINEIEIDDVSILENKQEHIPIEDNIQIENYYIIRKVTEDELKEWQKFREEEKKAFDIAKKEIEELKLEMKLINVHFLYQKKKVIFNFTADNRIDFRQLVKKLAAHFKTRIEMRQIGVRDAAKILGGYGVCGIRTCCSRSNCHVNSIFLKMAKDQGYIVSSSKLTGLCGRLMCCLAYEYNFYCDELKIYPPVGSIINYTDGEYKISSLNILTKDIYITNDNHHQKKIKLQDIEFVRKDNNGTQYYKFKNSYLEQNEQIFDKK